MTAISLTRSHALLDSPAHPVIKRTSALRGTRMTFGGLLYACIIVLIGLAALNSEANLLFLLFGISVGILLFSAVAPAWMVRRIDVERMFPQAVVAGRSFRIVYAVRSRRRWTNAWSLIVGEKPLAQRSVRFPLAFVPVLSPGKEQRIELMASCPHRGRVTLTGVRVLSRFPLGLFMCAVDLLSPAELTVYPTIGRFRRDPWKDQRSSGSSASRQTSHDTGQDEFYGVREYREGDNMRWIHWRRSARTGELVVREMMPLRPTQTLILLDPWPGPQPAIGKRDRRGEDRPELVAEEIINAAATALCDALERGHRVGLICRAAVPVVISPACGRPQRQRLLHELALIAPSSVSARSASEGQALSARQMGENEGLDELVARIRWSSGWHARCMLCVGRMDDTHQRVMRFLGGRAEALVALSSQSESFAALIDTAREPAAAFQGPKRKRDSVQSTPADDSGPDRPAAARRSV